MDMCKHIGVEPVTVVVVEVISETGRSII